jgi:hypothetical protein
VQSVSGNAVTISGAVTYANADVVVFSSATNQEVIAKAYPLGWAAYSLDSGSQTAVGNGTLGFNYGLEQAPFVGDTSDYAVIQLSGFWGTGTPSIYMNNFAVLGYNTQISIGDTHRAGCKVYISAGANGHLYGVGGVSLTLFNTFSPAVYAPNDSQHNTYTGWQASFGGSSNYSLTDYNLAPGMANVANGALSLPDVTAQIQYLSGPNVSGAPITLKVGINPTVGGDPVSATIRIGDCWAKKVSK